MTFRLDHIEFCPIYAYAVPNVSELTMMAYLYLMLTEK